MAQKLDRLRESPSQTAGPYVHIGTNPNYIGMDGLYAADLGSEPPPPEVKGTRIVVTGSVIDGGGNLVKDVLIEIWQADAEGIYPGRGDPRGAADPAFSGFARQPVDGVTGVFRFETIKPGSAPYLDGRPMAPHITVWIVARGINIGLHTRLYFADEEAANAADPVLARIDSRVRIATLIASRTEDAGIPTYRFDIRLQGEGETVFFDI